MVAMVWSMAADRIAPRNTPVKAKWYEKDNPPVPTDETVTLTRAELRALLEAVNTGNTTSGGHQATASRALSDFHEDFYQDGDESGYPTSPDLHATQTLSSIQRDFSTVSQARSSNPLEKQPKASKIELKRKQWLKEREESAHWDPWGRPGGGAPPASKSYEAAKSSLPYSVEEGDSQPATFRGFSGHSSIATTATSFIPFGSELPIDKNDKLDREQRRSNNHWYSSDYPGSPTGSLAAHSFARGQGMAEPMDPETMNKKLEKRQQMIEYQSFIKGQMEEKQRRQSEERDRKRKEEEEEERRLAEERVRMKEQFEMEQRQIKLKEEQGERKRQVLIAAVKNAEEAAEAEKRAKKALRRKATCSSPQPTQLENTFTIRAPVQAEPMKQIPPKPDVKESYAVEANDDEETASQAWATTEQHFSSHNTPVKSQQTAAIRPVQSNPTKPTIINTTITTSNSFCNEGRDFGVQTEPSRSPYIQNRLLTPSQWRIKERMLVKQLSESSKDGIHLMSAWGKFREMSTQTEIKTGRTEYLRPNNSAVIRSSSSSSSDPALQQQHLVRGQTSKPSLSIASKPEAPTSDKDNANKPLWGVNRPNKNFIKMTERDPNYNRRRKLQEMRKAHWERELSTQRTQMYQAKQSTQQRRNNLNPPTTYTRTPSSMSERGSSVTSAAEYQPPVILGATFTVARGQRAYTRVSPSSREGSGTSMGSPNQLPPLTRRWSHSTDSPHQSDTEEDEEEKSEERLHPAPAEGAQQVRRKWHSQENFFPPSHKGDSKEPVQGTPVPRRKWSEQDNFDLERVALLRAIANRNGIMEKEARGRSASADQTIRNEATTTEYNRNVLNINSHPTARQDKILQQLSNLRQGLLLKQREIESLLLHSP